MSYPAGYTFYGSANNGNQITLIGSDSTSLKPNIIIFDRKPATYDGGRNMFSVPELRVRVMRGVVTQDGKPAPQKNLIDASFRMPVEAAEVDVEANVQDFLSVISDEGFIASLKSLTFPKPSVSAP